MRTSQKNNCVVCENCLDVTYMRYLSSISGYISFLTKNKTFAYTRRFFFLIANFTHQIIDIRMEYIFSPEEIAEIQRHVAKYPDRKSAVMPALWMAQEKFGWLSEEAMQLVASTLDIPYSLVYGVASFYTMYFKKPVPKNLIEVCTCFSCSITGGPEAYDYLKKKLVVDENGVAADGDIWIREAECLGACDTAPMCQVSNRRYRHNLTPEKMDQMVTEIRSGKELDYEQIPLYDQDFSS